MIESRKAFGRTRFAFAFFVSDHRSFGDALSTARGMRHAPLIISNGRMPMDPKVGVHAEVVDAWLARAAAPRSTRALLRTFEATLCVVWSRSLDTLGAVTMNAVADRVLANAVAQFPCFKTLHPSVAGPLRCYELRLQSRLGKAAFGELVLGIRSTMIELLSLLASLTADILTPELHAELVRLPRAERPAMAVGA